MIDSPFREHLPRYVKPVIATYKRLGLTPNGITVLAFVVAAVAAWLAGTGHGVLAAATWWIGRFFDGTDGIYARSIKKTSDFGAYLDILLDMAAYAMMVFGLAHLHPQLSYAWMLTLYLYILCITSALALGSLEDKRGLTARDNRGMRLAAGLAEGGETGIAYTLFLLFPKFVPWLLPLWIVILATTVIARSILARTLLK